MKTKTFYLILMAFFAAAMMSCNPIEPYTPTTPTEPVKPVDPRTQPPVPVTGCVVFAEWPMKDACVAVADRNGDKEVQFDEAEAVTELIISGKGITDPKGLECFKNVKKLNISNNKITDISAVKNMVGIERLEFYLNRVASADFSDYSVFYNLKYIDGRGNLFQSRPDIRGCYDGISLTYGFAEYITQLPVEEQLITGRNLHTLDKPGYTSKVSISNRHKVLLQPKKGPGLWIRFFMNMHDKGYESGAADEIEQYMIESLFAHEPLKTFKDYFGILASEQTPCGECNSENLPGGYDSGIESLVCIIIQKDCDG